MSILDDFRGKSFMEQIAALSELERSGDTGAIPELLDLFKAPVGDAAVDAMCRNTLRSLLARDEAALLRSLALEHRPTALFAAGVAGESGSAGAVPLLVERARQWSQDPEALQDILLALGRIGDHAAVPLFREHLHNPDHFLAAMSIEFLGALGDTASQPEFEAFIEANELPERFQECELATWRAIDALAALGTDSALEYLTTKLHHLNPTARRMIHSALVRSGDAAVPHVCKTLRTAQDTDQRIMAANVLGFIGGKAAGDCLVQALDDHVLPEPNERFAALEALGGCKSIKSLVFLKDALHSEEDPLLLAAVLHGLETQATHPGLEAMAEELVASMQQEGPRARQATLILETMPAARTARFFASFCANAGPDLATPPIAATIDKALHGLESLAVSDAGLPVAFAGELRAKGLEQLAERVEGAMAEVRPGSGVRVMAVDDSAAMRSFYLEACAALGHEVVTAENGRQALDILEQGGRFDIFVVDMNMPVMDGIEFTTRIRAMEDSSSEEQTPTPILMASTEAARSQAQLARQAGVTTFLIKPFTKEVFQHKIRKILQ
jgi:CheY-like chemotaxis protein